MDQAIILKHVSYFYHNHTRFATQALNDVSLVIAEGSFTAIVGPSGSGKSTLLQHLNALLKPSKGTVTIGHHVISVRSKEKNVAPIRQKVGLVFQIPEEQLFGDTVRDDIAFGPRNFHFSPELIHKSVETSIKLVGLGKEKLSESPLNLSGGEKKRVAIAGVLACHPRILLLDEPTVGVDERESQKIMELIFRLHQRYHWTVVMITHQMDLVARYATQVVVMKSGRILTVSSSRALFMNHQLMFQAGLLPPFPVHFYYQLRKAGIHLGRVPLTLNDLANEIVYAKEARDQNE